MRIDIIFSDLGAEKQATDDPVLWPCIAVGEVKRLLRYVHRSLIIAGGAILLEYRKYRYK